MFSVILFIALGCLIGAIPVGYLVGLIHGVDIRKSGSGNVGATNAARTLGKKAGLFTLIGDITKGIIAVVLPQIFLWQSTDSTNIAAVCGLAAIFGHCFSPFLRFRGGKGVATSLGVFAVLTPLPLLFAAIAWAAVFGLSRYVSLSSITSSVVLALSTAIVGEPRFSKVIVIAAFCASALVITRHRSNIVRLCKGEELSFRK